MNTSPETQVTYERGGGRGRNRNVDDFVKSCAQPEADSKHFKDNISSNEF